MYVQGVPQQEERQQQLQGSIVVLMSSTRLCRAQAGMKWSAAVTLQRVGNSDRLIHCNSSTCLHASRAAA